MNRRAWLAALTAASIAASACGPAVVDRDADPPTAPATTAATTGAAPTSRPAPDPDASLDELLPELVAVMRGLDEQVIDKSGDEATLAHIDAIWAIAEPQVRSDHDGLLWGFTQAIELAHSAVARRRPADASKGYNVAADALDMFLRA